MASKDDDENIQQLTQQQHIQRLQIRKNEMIKRRRWFRNIHYLNIGLFLLLIVLVPCLMWYFKGKLFWAPLFAIYIAIPVAIFPYTRSRLRSYDQDLQEIDFEIDLLQFDVNTRETRAEKVLRMNNLQLKRYYDLNLGQNVWVFGLGIFCILLGITVIGVTFYLTLKVAKGLDAKIITGVVGSIGSMLSSYVAAIYLKMHAGATTHLEKFHSRLVETQQLLLGNLLASRIEDDSKRWETLSQLALNISK